MNKNKRNKASNPTVKARKQADALELQELQAKYEKALDEIARLKRELTDSTRVIESDLRAEKVRRIVARSHYKEADLEGKSIEQLQEIDETLSMGRVEEDETGTFKPIRAGASARESRLTVGNLHGKTREEILAMKGDF